MKVLICGGRNYSNWRVFSREVNHYTGHATPTIVAGGAKGADFLAKIYAEFYGLPYVEYPAKWSLHGSAAGPIRNQEMLDKEKPDLILAFPGGVGTTDMIKRSLTQGFTVVEIKE